MSRERLRVRKFQILLSLPSENPIIIRERLRMREVQILLSLTSENPRKHRLRERRVQIQGEVEDDKGSNSGRS